MKKNMLPLLAIAFVVAIISTGLFYGLFASKLSGSSVDLPKQSVVVSTRKLPRGAVLTAADVHVAEVRGRTAFGNSFSRPEQVIGSTVLDPVDESQVLSKSTLSSPNSTEGGNVPAGMRAVTIHVFESGGVFPLLRPGSRVDIQAMSDREKRPVSVHTVLQNIEVLSANSQPETVALRYSASMLTVLVRPEDSDLVAMADVGGVRVVLRNRLDESTGPRLPIGSAARAPGETGTVWQRIVAVNERGAEQLASSLQTPLDSKVPHDKDRRVLVIVSPRRAAAPVTLASRTLRN